MAWLQGPMIVPANRITQHPLSQMMLTSGDGGKGIVDLMCIVLFCRGLYDRKVIEVSYSKVVLNARMKQKV